MSKKTTLVPTRTNLILEINRVLKAKGNVQIRSYSGRYQTVLLISPAPKGAEKRLNTLLDRLRCANKSLPPVFMACTIALPDALELRFADYALPCRLRAEVKRVVEALFAEE